MRKHRPIISTNVTVATGPRPPIRIPVFGPQMLVGGLGLFRAALWTASLRWKRLALTRHFSRNTFRLLGGTHSAVLAALFEYRARVQAGRLAAQTQQVVTLRRYSGGLKHRRIGHDLV